MNIALTVIMPSLNVAEYIEKCLQSVVNQTLSNIEIICIDAGSTDGTQDIIMEYAREDSRINYVHSEVKSYGYQVNKGIQLARGEYIAILETDDYIAPNMYEKLYKCAKDGNLDISKSDFYYHTSNTESYCNAPSHISALVNVEYGKVYQLDEIPKMILFDAAIWKGIYKKSFLLDNKIELNNSKGAAYQDIGFLLQVAYANPRIAYIEDTLYYYRYAREGSSSLNKNVLGYIEAEWLFLEHKGLLKANCNVTAYVFSRLIICFIYEYNKLIEMTNDIEDCDYINDSLLRLKEKITEAIKNCISISKIIDTQRVLDVFEKNEVYVAKRQAISRKYNEEICKLKELLGKKPAVIFGCGSHGKKIRKLLYDCEVVPVCFCDSNPELWDSAIDDITVMNPANVLPDFSGTVIVASKYCYKEIESTVCGYTSNDVNILNSNTIFEMLGFDDASQIILS